MGRKPIGDRAMTEAERKRRQRRKEREPKIAVLKGRCGMK